LPIYLDTSAAFKLVKSEAESSALRSWMEDQSDGFISSVLLEVELCRSVLRIDPRLLPAAHHLLESIDLIDLSRAVTDSATRVGHSALRSLDALHLATVLMVRSDVSLVVTYDLRLQLSVEAYGIEVVAPGA
jgi:uncharacterized protein